jgi:hypothetical protein
MLWLRRQCEALGAAHRVSLPQGTRSCSECKATKKNAAARFHDPDSSHTGAAGALYSSPAKMSLLRTTSDARIGPLLHMRERLNTLGQIYRRQLELLTPMRYPPVQLCLDGLACCAVSLARTRDQFFFPTDRIFYRWQRIAPEGRGGFAILYRADEYFVLVQIYKLLRYKFLAEFLR